MTLVEPKRSPDDYIVPGEAAPGIDKIDVARYGEGLEVTVEAKSFLHRQVRSMVGSLMHVGEGKWSAGDLTDALEARDRAACGVIAPACGLYLVAVGYG